MSENGYHEQDQLHCCFNCGNSDVADPEEGFLFCILTKEEIMPTGICEFFNLQNWR